MILKKQRIKKALAASFLIFVLAAPMIAKAVVPLLWGLGIVTGVSTSGNAALLGSLAVHSLVGAVIFWNASSSSTSPPSKPPVVWVRMDDMPNPSPPGWTAPVNPAANPNPTPPASTAATAGFKYSAAPGEKGEWGPDDIIYIVMSNVSAAEASSIYVSTMNSAWASPSGGRPSRKYTALPPTVYDHGPLKQDLTWIDSDGRSGGTGQVFGASSSSPSTCEPGYSLSGSSCTLTDPSKVKLPKDTVCEILTVGGYLTPNPQDADCEGSASFDASFVSADKKVITVTADDAKTQASVKLNDDGSKIVTTTVDNGDGTVTTTMTNISPKPGSGPGANPNNSPSVTGQSTTTGVGTIQNPGGGGGGGGSSINLPTDYSRESTAAASLEELKKLNENPSNSDMPDAKAASDGLGAAQDALGDGVMGHVPGSWQGMMEKGIAFVLPNELVSLFSKQCQPWIFTFQMMNRPVSVDLTRYQNMIINVLTFLCWVYVFFGLADIFFPQKKGR